MAKNDEFIETVSPDTKERTQKCISRIRNKKVLTAYENPTNSEQIG